MRAAILCLAMVLVGGGVARADAGGARSHFLSGLTLYSQGKYAEALHEYQAAWVQWEDPELLLDMAECNRHLGKLDEAREQYRGFLERAPESPLRGSVERQLARLEDDQLPAASELVMPAKVEAVPAQRAGRTAKVLGIAGWATSAAALGLAIFTWHQSSALESAAHSDLVGLRMSNPLPSSPEEQAFFSSPGCSPPSTLRNSAQYVSDCNHGQQYSAATTGLFASGVALAAAGTIAYVVGAKQSAKARIEVAPAISYNAAALRLRFPF
jgi:tetratricopeptide (TPR) repeat protein